MDLNLKISFGIFFVSDVGFTFSRVKTRTYHIRATDNKKNHEKGNNWNLTVRYLIFDTLEHQLHRLEKVLLSNINPLHACPGRQTSASTQETRDERGWLRST